MLGREQLLPSWFARIHPTRDTPMRSAIFTGCTAGAPPPAACGQPESDFIDVQYSQPLLFRGVLVRWQLQSPAHGMQPCEGPGTLQIVEGSVAAAALQGRWRCWWTSTPWRSWCPSAPCSSSSWSQPPCCRCVPVIVNSSTVLVDTPEHGTLGGPPESARNTRLLRPACLSFTVLTRAACPAAAVLRARQQEGVAAVLALHRHNSHQRR